MAFGVPNFGMHFKWKEPLAVRHAVAVDPWYVASTSKKIIRAILTVVPFVIVIAIVLASKPERRQALGQTEIVALGGGLILLGWLVGFGIPLANHFTRRWIWLGENKIMIRSGIQPSASKYQRPVFDSHERTDVAAVKFERLVAKGREYEVLRIRLKWGTELVIGIGAEESPDEVFRFMKEWGYPVAG